MLEAEEVGEFADEIVLVVGEFSVRINHAPHRLHDLDALAERIEIVKTMWRMVYADGKLTDYENYLVRKLADLLGLEHHVMIDAKVAILREIEST